MRNSPSAESSSDEESDCVSNYARADEAAQMWVQPTCQSYESVRWMSKDRRQPNAGGTLSNHGRNHNGGAGRFW